MDSPAGLDAPDVPDDAAEIRVLTLNCWGLRFISALREERLAEIGNRLAELATPSSSSLSSSSAPLSIVALQECWCRSDFDAIHARTRHVLPHARFFVNGVWGAGLAVLSRWPLAATDVCGYSLNGRPTAFWRGDWYVGKGIARAVVRVGPRLAVEVFVTHTHPAYEAGQANDSYMAHQMAQMWEMGVRAAEAATAALLTASSSSWATSTWSPSRCPTACCSWRRPRRPCRRGRRCATPGATCTRTRRTAPSTTRKSRRG